MRASTDNRVVDVAPGEPGAVVVEVVNTGEVIDGISANVIGLPEECVSSAPAMLPLFPASNGRADPLARLSRRPTRRAGTR